ncbi:FMN-binding protein [Kribbella voronezhensis]|uniref:FMN-binding protein n=1 Tax=Kribbella voronezhensis TaxID=2512212 RepID=A0A4R7SVH6_9ACTN|nr:FMN-binding protein [Kribbella voronezhensis]
MNGTSVPTRYGPVQVRLTIRNGRIVTATAIDYPSSGGRDRAINSYAIPLLQRETVAAQSAHVDTVSGATYTSDGYRGSLQAAIDAAHLKGK